MAIQRVDPGGLDVCSSASTLLSGGFIDDDSFVGVSNGAPAGRSNTNAYVTSVNNAWVGYFTAGNFPESIFGFAFYNPFTTFTNGHRLFTFQDGTSQQVDGRTDATGHIYFTRNGTTLGSASANALAVGWYYFEVKAKIHSSLGACELRVTPLGGSPSVWLTLTGVNTQTSGNAYANRFYVVSIGAGFQFWKDIYILDTGTGVQTNYLGDITVKTLYPASADGTFQQWSPNTGTQLAAVQEHTGTFPDGDTTYISDTVSGHISAFGMDTLGSATISGVIHTSYARTASSGTINQVLVQSGSVVETSATRTLTTSYKWYQDVQEQNPTGPAAWTYSSVNGTHPGVKIQATSASARVSQELLLVILSNAVTPLGRQPNVCIIC